MVRHATARLAGRRHGVGALAVQRMADVPAPPSTRAWCLAETRWQCRVLQQAFRTRQAHSVGVVLALVRDRLWLEQLQVGRLLRHSGGLGVPLLLAYSHADDRSGRDRGRSGLESWLVGARRCIGAACAAGRSQQHKFGVAAVLRCARRQRLALRRLQLRTDGTRLCVEPQRRAARADRSLCAQLSARRAGSRLAWLGVQLRTR